MASDPAPVRIRSFRLVTRIERRLHRVGPWQIPLPYGLSLRALLDAGAAFLVLLVLSRLPLMAAVLAPVPAPLRLGIAPVCIAWALSRVRPDGRAPARVACAWARRRIGPARMAAFRPARAPTRAVRLADLRIAPDGRGPVLRRARVAAPRGGAPLSFTLRYPAEVRAVGRTVRVRQLPGGPMWVGEQVTLRPGQRALFWGPEPS